MNEIRKHIDLLEWVDAKEQNIKDVISERGRELLQLCGNMVGEGDDRQVYEHLFDPGLVIKLDKVALQKDPELTSEQNQNEWHVWEELSTDDELSQWFAPCIEMTSCTYFLVQKRVQKIEDFQLPELVPELIDLFDHHKLNWGMHEDHPVLLDYGWGEGCDDINLLVKNPFAKNLIHVDDKFYEIQD